MCSGSYLPRIPLSLFPIWLTEVSREEGDNFQIKLPLVLFGVKHSSWIILKHSFVRLLFSTTYVQLTRVFLFGLYLPLLTQSWFLFSLDQTTVLPLPLTFSYLVSLERPFSLKHVSFRFSLTKNMVYSQADTLDGKHIFFFTNKFIFIQEEFTYSEMHTS